MLRNPVCIGIIIGAKGLNGALRIKSFTGQPEDVGSYGPVTLEGEDRTRHLRVVDKAKGSLVLHIGGVEDRAGADALKGKKLFVDRAALPSVDNGEFYHTDLIGLPVRIKDGEELGSVYAIYDFGGGDIIDVKCDDGTSVLVPFTEDAVPEIDIDKGQILVVPPKYFETDSTNAKDAEGDG